MKPNNFYKICILLIGIVLFSCNNDDDNNAPIPDHPDTPGEPLIEANITIPELKEILLDEQDNTAIASDLIVEGYVVSSDASGNFYKELYLQNHPSNPTAGIRLEINRSDLYQTYEVGVKLYIHLEGLFLKRGDNGIISITENGDLDTPEAEENPDYITKSIIVEDIQAKPVLFSEITEAHIGTYVSISNTQVRRDALELAFVDEEALSTQRILEHCGEETSFLLETKATAGFSDTILPDTNGTVSGIVTRGVMGENLVLMLNEAEAMVYDEGERCDFLICETTDEAGVAVVFEEDFETISDEISLENLGWTTITMDEVEIQFEPELLDENTHVTIGAYETGEETLESWLVSPLIYLDDTTEETLTFDISTGHGNGEALTVLITDDYTGDPRNTVWQTIKVTLPESPEEGFGALTTSALINLDCLEGDVHLAFQYQGGDPELVTSYRIDNISVMGTVIEE